MRLETAKQVHERVLQSSRALNEALALLQQDVPADDFDRYRREVGQILAGLMDEFLLPIYQEHEELIPPELDRRYLKL